MTLESVAGRQVRRRRLLWKGAAVAAGAAGASMALSSPARAAAGDTVKLGQLNDAGTSSTGLSAAAAEPTLTLANASGPTLRIEPTDGPSLPLSAPIGAIAVDADGELLVSGDYGDATNGQLPFLQWVYSSRWASMTVPTKPTRVFDSRIASNRAAIVSGANRIDSAGLVEAGTTLVISLDTWVNQGAAVHANLTVAKTASGGYLTVWGSGKRPTASALNWWGAGQALSNGLLVSLGTFGSSMSAIAIYTTTKTAILMDVTAFDVAGPWQVASGVLASTAKLAQTPGTRSILRPPGNRAIII